MKLQQITLNEANLNKMLTTHSQAGYIILSAFRGENTFKQNMKNTEQLQTAINGSGFSYFPVWGGFVETNAETGEQTPVKEKSFVVLSFKRGTKEPIKDFEELRNFGLEQIKEFEQEQMLVKPPGAEKASYVNQSGQSEMSFSVTSPTQASDMYFTHLSKSKNKPMTSNSFTYREGVVYLATPPASLTEAVKRYGELFFRLNPK